MVGVWGGSLGGAVTGGCARRRVLLQPGPGAKGPADEGPAGAFAHIIQNLPLVLNSHSY